MTPKHEVKYSYDMYSRIDLLTVPRTVNLWVDWTSILLAKVRIFSDTECITTTDVMKTYFIAQYVYLYVI